MSGTRIASMQIVILLAATAASAQEINSFGMPVPGTFERKRPGITEMPPAETGDLNGGLLNGLGSPFANIGKEYSGPDFNSWPKQQSCVQDISKPVAADTLEFCNASSDSVVLSFEIGGTTLSVGLPPGQSSGLTTQDGTAIIAGVGSPQSRYAVAKGHFYTIEKTNDQLVVNSP